MANIDMFDKAGRFSEPDPRTLAALTPAERMGVARIRDASRLLDAANGAAQTNADALKSVQAEIAGLEKVIPKITFNDLAKAQARETQRRRAGV